jgi:hypothetical protein
MVHRLDRDTSGVQIAAKTKAAAAAFMKVRPEELEIDHEWGTIVGSFALSWKSAPTYRTWAGLASLSPTEFVFKRLHEADVEFERSQSSLKRPLLLVSASFRKPLLRRIAVSSQMRRVLFWFYNLHMSLLGGYSLTHPDLIFVDCRHRGACVYQDSTVQINGKE